MFDCDSRNQAVHCSSNRPPGLSTAPKQGGGMLEGFRVHRLDDLTGPQQLLELGRVALVATTLQYFLENHPSDGDWFATIESGGKLTIGPRSGSSQELDPRRCIDQHAGQLAAPHLVEITRPA